MGFLASLERVAFVGDTHGDIAALRAAFDAAADHGAGGLVSVGDLWWRPASPGHSQLVAAIEAAGTRTGVHLLLVDGNNDDAASLLADAPPDRPRRVLGSMSYAPRASSWEWGPRRFAALGGAVSYRVKTPGRDWFAGEALCRADVERAVRLGSVDVLVTHDAPAGAPLPLELTPGPDAQHRELVRSVFDALAPALLIHGHYHRSYEAQLGDARVIGLGRDRDGTSDVCVLDLEDLAVVARMRVG